jgi:hypothetical protein
MLAFENVEDSKNALAECESTRGHSCLKSSSEQVLALLKKAGPPKSSEGTNQFEIAEVEPFFIEMSKRPNDPYLGGSRLFFFN